MGWLAILTTLGPIVIELLKIFFGGSNEVDKQKLAEKIRDDLAKIRAASDKAAETGDTSDIEDIINHRH